MKKRIAWLLLLSLFLPFLGGIAQQEEAAVAGGSVVASQQGKPIQQGKPGEQTSVSVNPKWLPKAPADFVPKVRWHQGNLERHWEKHKAEFPEFKTAKEYGDAALYFFSKPPQGTLTKVDAETGDKKYYHQTSNTFGVTTSQGIPKTMFRPNAGINYWRRQ